MNLHYAKNRVECLWRELEEYRAERRLEPENGPIFSAILSLQSAQSQLADAIRKLGYDGQRPETRWPHQRVMEVGVDIAVEEAGDALGLE